MALSICVAVSANWPEYAIIKPILTVSCAFAEKAANIAAAMTSIVFRMISLPVAVQKRRRPSHYASVIRGLRHGDVWRGGFRRGDISFDDATHSIRLFTREVRGYFSQVDQRHLDR